MMGRPDGRAWRKLCALAKTYYPWTCHLCERAIDPDAEHNSPGEWTLDHLDPYAVHGESVPPLDRVRPAHRGCNSRRGIKEIHTTSPRSEDW